MVSKLRHDMDWYPDDVTYKILSFTGIEPTMELRHNKWKNRQDTILHIEEASSCIMEISYTSPDNCLGCEKEVQYLQFEAGKQDTGITYSSLEEIEKQHETT